jgi:hypothetical protein
MDESHRHYAERKDKEEHTKRFHLYEILEWQI